MSDLTSDCTKKTFFIQCMLSNRTAKLKEHLAVVILRVMFRNIFAW